MVVQEKLYTIEEYWEITQLPENRDRRLELVEGVICEVAASSPINTVVAMRIGRFLGNFVDERGLGYITGADGGFTLGPRTVRLPDVAYISKKRQPDLAGTVFPVAPDLAVEVVSPSETSRDVLDKARGYLQAGTRLVWVVYPENKIADVHRLAADGSVNIQTINIEGALDGGEVLPGFSLPVRSIFPE